MALYIAYPEAIKGISVANKGVCNKRINLFCRCWQDGHMEASFLITDLHVLHSTSFLFGIEFSGSLLCECIP